MNKTSDASEVLNGVDWKELHSAMAFSQAGDKVILWWDGTISTMDSGTYPNPDSMEKILHIFHPAGMGNVDHQSSYFENWGTEQEDGTISVDETGEIMTLSEAIADCVENGDFTDWYEGWENEVMQEFEEEL